MFETICNLIPQDPRYPSRARTLDILKRVLDGKLYDVLPYQFHEERGAGGEYIPLRNRRPSVRYALCRIVVEDSVSLLFSEGHFPTIDCADRTIRAALADIAKEARLNSTMIEAAICGAIGSVAILMRVVRGRIFFDVLDTTNLTPEWDPHEPDTLLRITEKYRVTGSQLPASGYDIAEPGTDYWFARSWDADSETWFVPTPVGSPFEANIDPLRSVQHGLGFVPIVWIRNLPGPSSTGNAADGACTFRAAIETQIEIDYQLSQAGRGLKYSSDPTLLIKEPATTDNEIVKGAGNALVVSEKGDAKLLEIGGTASAAVIEYVRTLRELALESVHGNRANADRLTAAQSGRALELMNQGLIWLADNLRISYGEGALLSLARMVLRASQVYQLHVMGREIPAMDVTARLSLKWPRWYPTSADDRQKDAQTLSTLAGAGQISRESAVKAIADTYDIEDVPAEILRINADSRTNGSH
jgi:Phage portal protein, SPP1 Gp6-like